MSQAEINAVEQLAPVIPIRPEQAEPSTEFGDSEPPDSERWPRLRRLARYSVAASGALTFGVLGFQAGDEATIKAPNLGATIETDIGLSWGFEGDTRFETPAGDTILDTHDGWLGVDINLRDVPLSTIERLSEPGELSRLPTRLKADREELSRAVVLESAKGVGRFGAGALVGWTAGSLLGELFVGLEGGRLHERRWRRLGQTAMRGGVVALGLTGALALPAYVTRDSHPASVSTGILNYAESQQDLAKLLDEHDARFAETAGHFFALSNAVGALTDSQEPAFCLAVVADGHNRNFVPLLSFVIDQNPCVKGAVDAGDITDYGSPAETLAYTDPEAAAQWRDLTLGIKDLPVPYFIVKGNHDQRATMAELDGLPNVRVLDGQVEVVPGTTLRIVGLPDRDYAGDDLFRGTADRAEMRTNTGRELQQLVIARDADLAVVHNHLAAALVTHGARVVVSGHSHACEPEISISGAGVVSYNQGSSGGVGLRTFDTKCRLPGESGLVPQPQTISVLQFNEQNQPYAAREYILRGLGEEQTMISRERPIECRDDCLDPDD